MATSLMVTYLSFYLALNLPSLTIQQSDYDNNKMDTVTLARQERQKNGPWEVECSYGGEADLHRHLDACDKNPDHLKFIPLDKFDVSYLPSRYHDDDLVGYVRAVADLTVRVSVTYVSEARPVRYPRSCAPYPYSSSGGSNMMRVGTGWVCSVSNYLNNKTCDCKGCLSSPTPKTQFAHIYIYTAAHVVYDDLEAAHTTCHLFFDRGGTPDVCNGTVTLSGMSRVRKDLFEDRCEMIYVTHDLDLADKLDKMTSLRQSFIKIVEKRYYSCKSTRPWHNAWKSQRFLDNWHRLTIIVSHPHGCSKQVSVGYCTNTDMMSGDEIQYRYTTATCPGSSGAPVCVIGRRQWADWYYSHVHGGNCEGNKDLNFSCYAADYSVIV